MTLRNRLVLSTIVALGMSAGAARADIIVALDNATLQADGSYAYTYNVQLAGQTQLNGTATTAADGTSGSQDFGTVYDFGPILTNSSGTLYTATGLLSNTFTFSFANTTTPPQNTTPTDSATLTNIRFTYAPTNTLTYLASNATSTSPGYTAPAGTALMQSIGDGVSNLGTFTVLSAYAPGTSSQLAYDGASFKSTNDSAQQNLGRLNGPVVTATAVPEPASLALLGAGLIGAGMVRRRKSLAA